MGIRYAEHGYWYGDWKVGKRGWGDYAPDFMGIPLAMWLKSLFQGDISRVQRFNFSDSAKRYPWSRVLAPFWAVWGLGFRG